MPYLEREGAKIFYEDNGIAEDGRTAILWTHGYGAGSAMWQGQVDAFGDRFRMIRWDVRGHGRSEVPDDMGAFSTEHVIADMTALLDHLCLERVILAGHSLGGFMSLRFHSFYPERVIALILQGSGPGFRNAEAREKWNVIACEKADALEAEGLPALRGGAEAQLCTHISVKALANAARGILTHTDSRVMEHLADITVPTLILVGGDDKHFLGAASYMEKKIAGSRQVVFADAHHGCNVDQPDAVNRALGDFLAGF